MSELIVLSRSDLQQLMQLGDYVEVVAQAFAMHAEGRAASPPPLHIPAVDGGFHVKAASLSLSRGYVAVKTNANFPFNRQRAGLPTIQGAILLFAAEDGTPLALLDSIDITIKRTGAATAIAARYLARPDSKVATICGCGEQGRVQLAALRHSLNIQRAYAWDSDPDAAAAYARAMSDQHGIVVTAANNLGDATSASDVIVTCTSSKIAYLGLEHVREGTFIAAVGADNPEKSEIEPALMARTTIVADIAAQSAVMGDLHHAIRSGSMTADALHAELGEVITAKKTGRTNSTEITIFDSTGTGIQDVAAAARAYELARDAGVGARIQLS
ncbi:MAG TPA: ornithine cyclodeaminase family protein [Burkholderiales bacterium]|nr:ornithine cyclodeaminase family protein [Burkholderiales bacterium]